MRSSFCILVLLFLVGQVSAADVWNTNTTAPPQGSWVVNLQVNCTGEPCQARLIHLVDWETRSVLCRYGSGSYIFPYTFDNDTYFFRTRNCDVTASYTQPQQAPALPVKCPLTYPRTAVAILVTAAVFGHCWWLGPLMAKPCPFKGVGAAAVDNID